MSKNVNEERLVIMLFSVKWNSDQERFETSFNEQAVQMLPADKVLYAKESILSFFNEMLKKDIGRRSLKTKKGV